ncbi:MAG: KTSC domain-containing protein [Verrucomicrobia bacterium]|nr:MAG: KTSC domain-containing protein [Verrucomicrobiota bacterium]PYL63833.1 MAG: KTSC domain-containing protein [Verrucomicrobiota bacterium]
MTRQLIISTGLKSVGYDAVAHVIEVELLSGRIQRYFDVPQPVYEALKAALSKTQYFNDNVAGKYESCQIV